MPFLQEYLRLKKGKQIKHLQSGTFESTYNKILVMAQQCLMKDKPTKCGVQ